MIRLDIKSNFYPVLVSASVSILLTGSGCGKKVDLAAIINLGSNFPANNATGINPGSSNGSSNGSSPSQPSPIPVPGGSTLVSCTESQKAEWKFTQPENCQEPILDILFVENSSKSMHEKRVRLAKAIPEFLSKIDPKTDYKISVMLGHGGESYYSGRLYSAGDSPLVLSSKLLSVQAIQKHLQNTLESVRMDLDEARGEALLYSLYESLEPRNLLEIRKLGFYRENAALSVVFVTDQGDLCYRHDSGDVDDSRYSGDKPDQDTYRKYCLNPIDKTRMRTPDFVFERFKEFKNGKTLSFDGILSRDGVRSPGILELIQKDPNGVVMDIESTDFSIGLGKMVQTLSQDFKLKSQFLLDGGFKLNPKSIAVRVDGVSVNVVYSPIPESVSLPLQDLGHCGSVIEVNACKL